MEDEPLVAMVLADILEDYGFQVADIAETLDEASRAVEQLDFDVAIFDVHLHGDLSYPAAERVIDLGKPMIFVSGYATRPPPPKLSSVPFLAKPCGPPLIASALNEALERAALTSERRRAFA